VAIAPTGPRAIVDASVATLPNDAAPVIAADAKPVVADKPVAKPVAPRASISDDEARRIADTLTALGSSNKDSGDMSKRMPIDLGRQIDAIKDGGRTVSIGGGRGGRIRGDGDARVGTGRIGGIGQIDTNGGEKKVVGSGPTGRVSISSKRAIDDTTLTVDIVVAKVMSSYMAGIKRCYKRYLDTDASARGKVSLAFSVIESGAANGARASGFAKSVDDCLANVMAGWRFPSPKDKDGERTAASFEIALQLVPD
jgi:hypothetical protein